jgi:hypothetical protein
MNLWLKTYGHWLLAAMLVVGTAVGIRYAVKQHRLKFVDPAVQLEAEKQALLQRIDSLEQQQYDLQASEANVSKKYRIKNEKELIYIMVSADSVQPDIRTKYRARADSLLAGN